MVHVSTYYWFQKKIRYNMNLIKQAAIAVIICTHIEGAISFKTNRLMHGSCNHVNPSHAVLPSSQPQKMEILQQQAWSVCLLPLQLRFGLSHLSSYLQEQDFVIKPQATTPPLNTSQWPLLLKVGRAS